MNVDNLWCVLICLDNKTMKVVEVYLETDTDELWCSCGRKRLCRHIEMVQGRMAANGGFYPMVYVSKPSRRDVAKATLNPDEYREFVLKHTRIEVL